MLIKGLLFDMGDTLLVEDPEFFASTNLWEVSFRTVEGAKPLLKNLYGKYKMAVITNTETMHKYHVRFALRKAGIEDFFDAIVVSLDFGVKKPEPEIYLEALKAIDAKPSEAVMIGNRLKSDITGANRLGIKTIYLKWNKRYDETPSSIEEKPDYTISKLNEILPILKEIQKQLNR